MTHRTGAWIEQQHADADQIDARLDRMLAGPDRPTLAWIGIKSGGARTVHVKGRDGQTEQIEHDPKTFTQQIEDLAQAWGGGSASRRDTAPADGFPDAASVYDRRREQAAAAAEDESDQATPERSTTGLPDPDDVYAQRAAQEPSGDE